MSALLDRPEGSGPLRLAVLVSGSGTNLQAVLDAAPGSAFEVRVVVSNKAGAKALERAERAGVPTVVEPHQGHATRAHAEERGRDGISRRLEVLPHRLPSFVERLRAETRHDDESVALRCGREEHVADNMGERFVEARIEDASRLACGAE